MTACALVDTCEAAGIRLSIDIDGLLCDAPITPEADALLALIREHKAAVVAELMRPPDWLTADPHLGGLLRAGLSPDEAYDFLERLAIETEPAAARDPEVRLSSAEHHALLPYVLAMEGTSPPNPARMTRHGISGKTTM